MRHADDGIHRRTNLMTHVGQEVGLGLSGGFCHLLCSPEFCIGAQTLSDVAECNDGSDHLPILKDWRSGVFGRKPRSIFTPENLVAYHSMFTVLRRLVHAALFPRERRTISMGIVNERMHRLANEFLWSETQHLSSRCIYKSRPSFRSQPADAFIHGRQDQSGAFLNHG